MNKMKLLAPLLLLFEIVVVSCPAYSNAEEPERFYELVGENIEKPVIVQGRTITVVVGNTFVNESRLVNYGHDDSVMVDLRTPEKGSRIIFRDNRTVNRSLINQRNGDGAAAMTMVKRTPGRFTAIQSAHNIFQNRGKISKRGR